MSENIKPKCPYCGTAMVEKTTVAHTFYYACPQCLAQSPHEVGRADAAEAAMRRAEPACERKEYQTKKESPC